jgi:hypothetical protein
VTDNSLHSAFAQQPRTNLIADLVMGRLIPAPIWQKRNYRLKFLLRTALFYTPTRAMLDNLSVRPDFNQLLAAQVTLPGKVHRQYLTTWVKRQPARPGDYQPLSVHRLTVRRAAGCRHDRRQRDDPAGIAG